MHASRSAIDSALPPLRRGLSPTASYEVTRHTLRVAVLNIAMPGQDQQGVFDPGRERREAVKIWLLTVLDEVWRGEREARPIQAVSETWPGKSRGRFENAKCSWVHAAIFALVAGCCAITVFFAFQAPFRLRANESRVSTGEFRGEIAALPVRLAGQTMADFRTHRPHRSTGDDREVMSSSFDDSNHKRRMTREHLAQRKQLRIHMESAEFSRRN
jgi:hypothetical protein